jgi:hypothetical protein
MQSADFKMVDIEGFVKNSHAGVKASRTMKKNYLMFSWSVFGTKSLQ